MSYFGNGTTALRYLKSLAIGKGDHLSSVAFAQAQTWHDKSQVVQCLKSGIPGLARDDFGSRDVGVDLQLALRPLSVVGRLQGLRRLPPNVRSLSQQTGTTAAWAAEGKAPPASAGSYTADILRTLKVVARCVASDELLADGSPDAEAALLDDLLAACAEALDRAFIDPLNVGDDATPASITSAATPINSGNLDSDLATAISQLLSQGSNLRNASWIMGQELAGRMSLALPCTPRKRWTFFSCRLTVAE